MSKFWWGFNEIPGFCKINKLCVLVKVNNTDCDLDTIPGLNEKEGRKEGWGREG